MLYIGITVALRDGWDEVVNVSNVFAGLPNLYVAYGTYCDCCTNALSHFNLQFVHNNFRFEHH